MSEVAKPNRKLAVHEMPLAEYHNAPRVAFPEAGTAPDEMLNPAYWANVYMNLRRGDVIHAHAADGAWHGYLYVRAVLPFATKVAWEPGSPQVFEARNADVDPAAEVPEGYEVKHRGRAGWTIIRIADRAVLTERLDRPFNTRAAALDWLNAQLRVLEA